MTVDTSRPLRRGPRRAARVAALLAALVSLLLGGLTACDTRATGQESSLSAPGAFYLRPHGDRSGPAGKVPFHVRATDGRARDGTGPVDHELTMDLRGAGAGLGGAEQGKAGRS